MLQANIADAMKIKNHIAIQQKKRFTGKNPINKSMEGKCQNENKNPNKNKTHGNEQSILDSCWNKLLSTANGTTNPSTSVSLSISQPTKTLNTSLSTCKLKSLEPAIQTNRKIGCVQIITTKGKVGKRQMSPLVASKQNFVFGGEGAKKRRPRGERMNRKLSPLVGLEKSKGSPVGKYKILESKKRVACSWFEIKD
eukprot:TRINITY_DN3725_c0_g1_i13.p2 TRINITY_DN3725_c0_g1~~TRINITY_DN3725_c0_g1_i13.p2  ORF type:complete len:196 (+),score=42.47 TRINITY_DN3725_c0_g1_i13:416-1003(+)